MKKRICPVCDQEMHSSHYCRICRRFVKKPHISEVNYYLNEAHSREEADCSYHNTQTEQGQISTQPQGGWQRTTPVYQTSQMMRPARTAADPMQTGKKQGSNQWILLLAAFFVVIFVVANQVSRYAPNQVSDVEYDSGYDVDLGIFEQGWDPPQWDEEDWQDLTDDEVRAMGERCTDYLHFSVTYDELESEVMKIIENHGFQVQERDSYSDNSQYLDVDDTEYTSYCTWISYEIEQEQADFAMYLFESVYFDYDTATDELHSIEINLADPDQVITICGEILELMETKEMITAAADYEQILINMNQQSFYDEAYYITADGGVEISCYEYDGSYCIYIRPSK